MFPKIHTYIHAYINMVVLILTRKPNEKFHHMLTMTALSNLATLALTCLRNVLFFNDYCEISFLPNPHFI